MNHVDPVSMWNTFIECLLTIRFQLSGDGTVPEIFKLVVRALLGHDVISNSEYFRTVSDAQDLFDFVPELVRLAPQTVPDQGQTSKRRVLPGVLINIYNQWRMERKVKKVVYER